MHIWPVVLKVKGIRKQPPHVKIDKLREWYKAFGFVNQSKVGVVMIRPAKGMTVEQVLASYEKTAV
jgi:hypothetical protein